MKLKQNQKVKCVKSWRLTDPDKTKEIVEGKTYEIYSIAPSKFSVLVEVEEMMMTWMGSVPAIYSEELWFMYHEFETYFEDVLSKTKCDCGFIVGVSAVHYPWCSTKELIA